ncbi:hypothetical protein AC1031_018862 [Aphanomyces cochlioides]|nr:hypothetical protein AC1031_018862 [Aphanomyces cochlioides]
MWSFGCFCYELAVGHPPFQMQNDALPALFESIQRGFVYFPPSLNPCFVAFVKGCLDVNPATRFTTAQAMDHPFFKDIAWSGVLARHLKPPFIPPVDGIESTQNFDDDFTSESPRSPTLLDMKHKRLAQDAPGPEVDVFVDF